MPDAFSGDALGFRGSVRLRWDSGATNVYYNMNPYKCKEKGLFQAQFIARIRYSEADEMPLTGKPNGGVSIVEKASYPQFG